MTLLEETELQGNNMNALLQSARDAEIIAYVDGLFNRARKARQQFEKQWYLNLAFYFGRQYAVWAPGTATGLTRLWEPPAPPWRVRLITNQIRPIIRTELSKCIKERPQAFVVPSTSDDQDTAAARAAENIFEYQRYVMEANKVMRRSIFWTLLCGSSFIKDWYEPDTVGPDGVAGTIKVEPVTAFHIYIPDPQEEDLENQPYIIHCLAKSPEYVEGLYGKKVGADSTSGSGLLEQRFLNALGIESAPKSYVTVKEAWIKPCQKFKNGAVVTWAGSTILNLEENGFVYQHGQYPFTKIDHIPTGRFYGDSVINDLIPLQRELNRSISQIIEAKNRMAKPQLAAQKGSIDTNKVTSEPGLIILYQPGYQPPTPIPLTNLPTYVMEQIQSIKLDMQDISGQHEISKGQVPSGVTAATAISYLQESDDTKLAPTITSIEEAVERIGRHTLSHVQQFWDLPRIVKVVGDDGQYESFELSKADIRGNTDLRIEAGSATPRSRAAKQAFITELGKMGWITPDRALRYLDMAETSKLYEEIQVDSRQAQRENLKMAQGAPIPVNDWDNHEIHMLEHNNYRKRQAYENLPDELKAIFQQHVQTHKNVLAASMGVQTVPGQQLPNPDQMPQQQQQPPPGGPGGNPEKAEANV
jgi:hypothetical protein